MNASTTHKAVKIAGILIGSVVAVVGALLVVVMTAGGLFVPARYLEPWDKEYSATFEDPRVSLVAQAILAPSSHNEQPWIVRLDESDDSVLRLYTDDDRLTPEVDPLARQTMITQGTFLQYLRTAGSKIGTDVSIELFPEGDYDESNLSSSMQDLPVAKITLRPSSSDAGDTGDTGDDMYDSLFLSDTNRSPYTPTELTADQEDQLEDLSTTGIGVTVYRGHEDVVTLSEATIRGSVIESRNPDVAAESAALFRANETEKNAERSGFAVEGQGTTGFMKYLLQGVTTLLPASNSPASAAARDVGLAEAGATQTPAYALVETPGNSRAEQVQAGMLYAKLALRARGLGLVVQPVSQILEEYPDMRAERKAVHEQFSPDGGTLQMLVRLGTPTVDYPLTMRRDVNDIIRATP